MNTFPPLTQVFSYIILFVFSFSTLQAGIDCPPDKIVSCEVALDDFSVLEEAVWDWEGINGEIFYEDIYQNDFVELCNYGTVERRWYMEETGDECFQYILLEVETPFDGSTIQWPDDVTLNCWSDDYDDPIFFKTSICEFVGLNTKVDTIPDVGSSCALIQRTHTIVNWCTGDEYSDVQQIYILDDIDPELVSQDSCYEVDADCLYADLVLTAVGYDTLGPCASNEITWEVFVDLWGDWTIDYQFSSYVNPFDPNFGTPINELFVPSTLSGEQLNLLLPEIIEGSKYQHRVVWKANDGCNNITSHTSYFTVEDKKTPTPYCLESITTTPNFSNTLEIWASEFELNSFDNCTEYEQLRFSFSEEDEPINGNDNYNEETRATVLNIDCNLICEVFDAGGKLALDIYVWDEFDNTDHCSVELSINGDGECHCNGDPGFSEASFRVKSETGEPIENSFANVQTVLPDFPLMLESNEVGIMSFTSNDNFDYNIHFISDSLWLNGVSTLDIVKIQQHILGLQDLNEKALLQADVNQDQLISASDLLAIRRLILGIDDQFEHSDNWLFTCSDSTSLILENAMNNFSFYLDRNMDETITAYKMGDVNDSAIPNPLTDEADTRSSISLKIKDRWLTAGSQVNIPIHLNEAIELEGLQAKFSLNGFCNNWTVLDGLEGDAYNKDKQLSISYTKHVSTQLPEIPEPLITLNFTPEESAYLSDLLSLSNDFKHEIYDASLDEYQLTLEFIAREKAPSSNFNIAPNPFTEQTSIEVVGCIENCELNVFSIAGQLIESRILPVNPNQQSVELGRDYDPGVYFVQWNSGIGKQTQKIIKQ